jgi:hypothetical protein
MGVSGRRCLIGDGIVAYDWSARVYGITGDSSKRVI